MQQHNLINEMNKTITEHNMIARDDKVIVGVSGGADSVALLRALHAIRDDYNLTLVVCHVNHKIRPGAAERDQEFVKSLCDDLGIEFRCKEADVEALAKEWNMGAEEAGRKVRYAFFNEIAGLNGKIATAHNKNDNAETVMMRFMRGTGLHGLTGIPYCRDNIIRPLLDISRDEIEEFLKVIGQNHITDESNFEAIYTRNKIRLNLIPEIQKEFNPNFIDTLTNNISHYREDEEYMSHEAEKTIEKCFEIANNSFFVYGAAKFEHVAILKRAIKLACARVFDVDLSSQMVNNIISLLGRPVGTKMTVVGEIIATVQYSGIVVQCGSPDKSMAEFNLKTDVANEVVLHTNNMTIKYDVVEAENVINNHEKFYYPVNLCKNGFTLRTRRDGDIVVIAPGIKKKLKKFFIDRKIDATERDGYWLLVNENNEVVWIPELFGSRLSEDDRNGTMIRFSMQPNE